MTYNKIHNWKDAGQCALQNLIAGTFISVPLFTFGALYYFCIKKKHVNNDTEEEKEYELRRKYGNSAFVDSTTVSKEKLFHIFEYDRKNRKLDTWYPESIYDIIDLDWTKHKSLPEKFKTEQLWHLIISKDVTAINAAVAPKSKLQALRYWNTFCKHYNAQDPLVLTQVELYREILQNLTASE